MTNTFLATLVVAVLGGGTVSAIIQWISGRRKTEVEGDSILVAGAKALVDPLVQRVDDMQEELNDLRSRVHVLEETERKHILWAQMNKIWPPDQAVWDSL